MLCVCACVRPGVLVCFLCVLCACVCLRTCVWNWQDLEAVVDEHGEGLADNADMQEAKALLEANPPPEN